MSLLAVPVRTPWYVSAQQRAVGAFNASTAVGDRGAMLRELCRLHGGYLDLFTSGIALNEEDLKTLARFGLKRVAGSGTDALIIDDTVGLELEDLSDVLRLDPTQRQTYPSSAADALLLRHSPFDKY